MLRKRGRVYLIYLKGTNVHGYEFLTVKYLDIMFKLQQINTGKGSLNDEMNTHENYYHLSIKLPRNKLKNVLFLSPKIHQQSTENNKKPTMIRKKISTSFLPKHPAVSFCYDLTYSRGNENRCVSDDLMR